MLLNVIDLCLTIKWDLRFQGLHIYVDWESLTRQGLKICGLRYLFLCQLGKFISGLRYLFEYLCFYVDWESLSQQIIIIIYINWET